MSSLPFIVFVLFEFKHYLCDFIFQNSYMLGKFKTDGWMLPLATHCAVHVMGTFLIACIVMPSMPVQYVWGLCFIDFVVHFLMDRIKASPSGLGRWEALTKATYPTATASQRHSNRNFWWALGFDQMVHNLTHIFLTYLIVAYALR